MNPPKHIHVIQGQLSALPVFWEAIIGGKTIQQIGGDGMVRRKRGQLPLENLSYWGVVCAQGRYGFNIETQTIIANEESFPCALPKNIHTLLYTRSVICSSDGHEETAWVRFGVNEIEMEILFWPNFKVNLPDIHEKNNHGQGRKLEVTEQLFQTYVHVPTGERAGEQK